MAFLITLAACSTSPDDKPLVPSDHADLKGGAFHKSGYEHPFETESNCSSPSCHHADLRGGWALVSETTGQWTQHSAPSCYQCHGVKWDDDRPAAPRVLYPTTDVVWRHGQSRLVEHWSRGAAARLIELLDGETVVATLATGSSTAEVLRVPEVDAAWGTGAGFRIRVTSGTDAEATGSAFSICDSDEVVVTRPLAGSAFSVGDEISVEWTCASGVAVDIDVVRSGVRVGDFRTAAGNSGVHSRVVTADWGVGTGFQLRITDFERTVGLSPLFDIVE